LKGFWQILLGGDQRGTGKVYSPWRQDSE